MHRSLSLSAACLVGLMALASMAPMLQAEEVQAPPFGLRNGQWIGEYLLVGGQPSAEQLNAIVESGVRSVVNLRGQGEQSEWDEGAELEVPYLHLPIASADDLDAEAARQLAAWLADEGHLPALVHCASGNRVGALFALKAFHVDGEDVASALQLGRKHGMTSLYEKVAEHLSEAPVVDEAAAAAASEASKGDAPSDP